MSFLERERALERLGSWAGSQRQLSLMRSTSQMRMDEQMAANNQMHDPLMREWETSRRLSDEGSKELRKIASGARLMAQKGTGYYSEAKYKMSG